MCDGSWFALFVVWFDSVWLGLVFLPPLGALVGYFRTTEVFLQRKPYLTALLTK